MLAAHATVKASRGRLEPDVARKDSSGSIFNRTVLAGFLLNGCDSLFAKLNGDVSCLTDRT